MLLIAKELGGWHIWTPNSYVKLEERLDKFFFDHGSCGLDRMPLPTREDSFELVYESDEDFAEKERAYYASIQK